MSIGLLIVIVVGIWLAFKAVGLVMRLAVWALVLFAAYWLIAPFLGWPVPGA